MIPQDEKKVFYGILEVNKNKADTVGELNPFRYRGYCYDVETGFYYLGRSYGDFLGRLAGKLREIVSVSTKLDNKKTVQGKSFVKNVAVRNLQTSTRISKKRTTYNIPPNRKSILDCVPIV